MTEQNENVLRLTPGEVAQLEKVLDAEDRDTPRELIGELCELHARVPVLVKWDEESIFGRAAAALVSLVNENKRLERRLWAALHERDTLAAQVRRHQSAPTDEQWQAYSDAVVQP